MVYRFAAFTLAAAIAVGIAMPGHRQAPVIRVAHRASPAALNAVVIQRQANGHFSVDGTVNGQTVPFVVDTGATTVALTAEDARRIGLQFDPGEFHRIGYGASGPVLGKDIVLDRVAVGGTEVSGVPAVIMADSPGLHVSLLGQSYLERVSSVQIAGNEMVIR